MVTLLSLVTHFFGLKAKHYSIKRTDRIFLKGHSFLSCLKHCSKYW